MDVELKTADDVDNILAELTGGPFTRLLGSLGRILGAAHLDAALDMITRASMRRRDAAARILVEIACQGNERAKGELIRLLACGPPHVRVALTFALPESVEWPVFQAAWKGAQRAFYRGSAVSERRLRNASVVLAILGVLGLLRFMWWTGENVAFAKDVSNWVALLVFGTTMLSVVPALLVWLRFPCRYDRLVGYQACISEMLRSCLMKDEARCLGLLPEAAAMTHLMNIQDRDTQREFQETVARMRDAALNRPSLPIPAETAVSVSSQLPIPDASAESSRR